MPHLPKEFTRPSDIKVAVSVYEALAQSALDGYIYSVELQQKVNGAYPGDCAQRYKTRPNKN